MKENKFDNFHFNLYKLKNQVNKFPPENLDEIHLIIFNNIIDSFPNETWFKIKNNYFSNLSNNDNKYIVIYTIIAYNLGNEFNEIPPILIDYYCTYIMNLEISPYQIPKYNDFLLNKPMIKIIMAAYEYKNIPPDIIIKLIIDSYDLSKITLKERTTIITTLRSIINKYEYLIFNGNYNFFNIYRSLKEIWEEQVFMENPNLPVENLELVLKFDEIPDEELKMHIKQNFAYIEKSSVTISKKFENCLTIIANFAYDLPTYQEHQPN